ncbi:Gbp1, partial [Symbiodinium sp. CCMP2456]
EWPNIVILTGGAKYQFDDRGRERIRIHAKDGWQDSIPPAILQYSLRLHDVRELKDPHNGEYGQCVGRHPKILDGGWTISLATSTPMRAGAPCDAEVVVRGAGTSRATRPTLDPAAHSVPPAADVGWKSWHTEESPCWILGFSCSIDDAEQAATRRYWISDLRLWSRAFGVAGQGGAKAWTGRPQGSATDTEGSAWLMADHRLRGHHLVGPRADPLGEQPKAVVLAAIGMDPLLGHPALLSPIHTTGGAENKDLKGIIAAINKENKDSVEQNKILYGQACVADHWAQWFEEERGDLPEGDRSPAVVMTEATYLEAQHRNARDLASVIAAAGPSHRAAFGDGMDTMEAISEDLKKTGWRGPIGLGAGNERTLLHNVRFWWWPMSPAPVQKYDRSLAKWKKTVLLFHAGEMRILLRDAPINAEVPTLRETQVGSADASRTLVVCRPSVDDAGVIDGASTYKGRKSL